MVSPSSSMSSWVADRVNVLAVSPESKVMFSGTPEYSAMSAPVPGAWVSGMTTVRSGSASSSTVMVTVPPSGIV